MKTTIATKKPTQISPENTIDKNVQSTERGQLLK